MAGNNSSKKPSNGSSNKSASGSSSTPGTGNMSSGNNPSVSGSSGIPGNMSSGNPGSPSGSNWQSGSSSASSNMGGKGQVGTEIVSTLNSLIETCKDGQQGFEQAAENVENSQLKSLFHTFSSQRAQFASELQNVVRSLGADPETSGHIAGTVHRGWMNIKSVVTGHDETAILAECERGEDFAVKAYEQACQLELPSQLKSVIQRQFNEVKAAHDKIHDLEGNLDSTSGSTGSGNFSSSNPGNNISGNMSGGSKPGVSGNSNSGISGNMSTMGSSGTGKPSSGISGNKSGSTSTGNFSSSNPGNNVSGNMSSGNIGGSQSNRGSSSNPGNVSGSGSDKPSGNR